MFFLNQHTCKPTGNGRKTISFKYAVVLKFNSVSYTLDSSTNTKLFDDPKKFTRKLLDIIENN